MEDEASFEMLAYECAYLAQNGWKYVGRALWWHPQADEPVPRDRAIGLQKTWTKDAEKRVIATERKLSSGSHKRASSVPEGSLIDRIRKKRRQKDPRRDD